MKHECDVKITDNVHVKHNNKSSLNHSDAKQIIYLDQTPTGTSTEGTTNWNWK